MPIDFQQLPHAGIRSLVPYKPGKSIEELAQERGVSDIIKLASNENPLGCSPLALAALRAMPASTVATYPSPMHHPLLLQLAKHLRVDSTEVFLSNGSDYICNLLLNCFALYTKKHILTHEYAFSTYAIQSNALQIPVRTVPVNADYSVDCQRLIDACNKDTALIFLANPNNPTGLLTSQAAIKQLLERIPEQTILVLDEAYYEFAADKLSCNSIEWLKEHPNLVIMRTFSKLYGLAGLRLGYCIANPAIITLLLRLQLPFTVNQVALTAAQAALEDSEFIARSLRGNQLGMQQMREGFQQLHFQYLPSACNFLTFDCGEDGNTLYNFLLDRGIIIRPLHAYQMNNWLRVTIGTEAQNQRVLTELAGYNQHSRIK